MSSGDVADVLVQSSYRVMAVLNRIGARHDLSLTQMRVLGILRDRHLRMSDLAEVLGLDRTTLSGLVGRAERRGLLVRRPSEADGRAIDVTVTSAGAELAAVAAAEVTEALEEVAQRLSQVERRQIVASLSRAWAGDLSATAD